MAKMFDNIEDVVNYGLENLNRAGTETLSEGSYGRSRLAEDLVDYKNLEVARGYFAGFDTFKEDWTDAFVQGFAPQMVTDANTGAHSYKFMFNVNRGGFARGTTHLVCRDINLQPCGDQAPTCPTLGGPIITGQSHLASVDFKQEFGEVSACLSDLYQITSEDVYVNRLARETGLSVTSPTNMGKVMVENAASMFEKGVQVRHLFEQYSDNGMVAIVETGGTGDGTDEIVVNRVDLLFLHETYAVMEPGEDEGGQDDEGTECTPYCYRTMKLKGFVQVSQSPIPRLQTVYFTNAVDIADGDVLPTVELAAGDVLVALTGTYHTYTGGAFGGGNYTMYDPMSGYSATQITNYINAPSCCNLNGYYTGIRLKYEIDNSLVTEYMGLPVSGTLNYKSFLTPYVFNTCCGGSTKAAVNAQSLFGYIERTSAVLEAMKQANWYGPALEGTEIVVEAAPLTMRALKKMVFTDYPALNVEKQMSYNPSTNTNVVLDPTRNMTFDSVSDTIAYPVVFRTIRKGMPEGHVRIGPRKPWVTAVMKGLNGDFATWSNANWTKEVPVLAGSSWKLPEEIARYKQAYVFQVGNTCDGTVSHLKWRASRWINRFNPTIGADTYILGFDYKKPLDCPATCITPTCDSACV